MTTERKSNIFARIIRYENDELEPEEAIELIQELIDTGIVWTLQGHYGRAAEHYIRAGLCHHKRD